MRRLIINADDFGLTAGVNRAILEAHEHGLVTSATAMAQGKAVEDALARARTAQGLSVGCHVVLIDGAPLLPREQVKTLLAPAANGARFRETWPGFVAAAARGRLRPEEMEAEITAQIRKLQAAGIRLSHLDSHKHVHLLPWVLRPLLRAARACGVGAVRNPFAPLRPLARAHLLRRPRLWTRYSEVAVLRRFALQFRRAVESEGMVTTDGTFGIVATGALYQKLFEAILGSIPEGTWELVCHPGYCDEDLRGVRTRLRESRARELEVLTSEGARRTVQSRDIELISYWDLQR